MPIVTLASTKGGSTKTTSAITLATTIAKFEPELNITLIDCDPEAYLSLWYGLCEEQGVLPANLKLVNETRDQHIAEVIHQAEEESDIVIIDPEGKATMLLRDAILLSDLTLIPLQPSPMDAQAIPKIVDVINRAANARRHAVVIDHLALFTRTKPGIAPSQEYKEIKGACEENEIPIMATELCEREVYKGYASVGGTLYTRLDAAEERRAAAQEQIDQWNQDNIDRKSGKLPELSDEEKTILREEKKSFRKEMSKNEGLIVQLEKAIANSEAVADEVLKHLQAAVEKRRAA